MNRPKKTSCLVKMYFRYVPRVIVSLKDLYFSHALPCVPRTSVPIYILSCTHIPPLYFTSKHAIRRILSFTHALWLYSIRRTLPNSKLIWWYLWGVVCACIWYRAIFCTILHIYAHSLMITYGKDPSITSLTKITIITCTLIYASLWNSPGPFTWWRCLPFSEEFWPLQVWCHCLWRNNAWRNGISHQYVLY